MHYFINEEKKVKATNTAARHLINLWLVGIAVTLLSDFILIFRHMVVSRLDANDVNAGGLFLNSISVELFTSLAVFTVLYYSTMVITQKKKVFTGLLLLNIILYGIASIFLPITLVDVNDFRFNEAVFAVFQATLPTLLIFINFLTMGVILKTNRNQE